MQTSNADVKFDMVDSVLNASGVETGTDQLISIFLL